MDDLINKAIVEILERRKEFLKVMVRQKNKFEGWLKFELAYYLETIGMQCVEVESKMGRRRDRFDITFFNDEIFYMVELKTPNTNWNINGIKRCGRPITKNIQSIIYDAKKLNSSHGIIAFVLFPIPVEDIRWKKYVDKISRECKIPIDKDKQCKIVTVDIDGTNDCELLVCSFKSREFTNWF